MKYAIAIAAISLGLAACTPAETEGEAEAAAEPAVEEVAVVAGGVAPGDYVVTAADGSEDPFSIAADGTWTGVDEEGNPSSGTSEVIDGKICFTDAGATEAECWTNGATAEDGSFESVSDAGDKVSVRPAA